MKLIDRIYEYLRSYDIEMVRLGVAIMREKINREEWEGILKECLDGETDEFGWERDFPKWTWKIDEYDEVTVDEYVLQSFTSSYVGLNGYSGTTYTTPYTVTVPGSMWWNNGFVTTGNPSLSGITGTISTTGGCGTLTAGLAITATAPPLSLTCSIYIGSP